MTSVYSNMLEIVIVVVQWIAEAIAESLNAVGREEVQ